MGAYRSRKNLRVVYLFFALLWHCRIPHWKKFLFFRPAAITISRWSVVFQTDKTFAFCCSLLHVYSLLINRDRAMKPISPCICWVWHPLPYEIVNKPRGLSHLLYCISDCCHRFLALSKLFTQDIFYVYFVHPGHSFVYSMLYGVWGYSLLISHLFAQVHAC